MWCDPSSQQQARDEFGEIGEWDVVAVTNMQSLFEDKRYFNDDISAWDVSNVKYMAYMFFNATSLRAMRQLILAEDKRARQRALAQVLPIQREDFVDIFRAMKFQ